MYKYKIVHKDIKPTNIMNGRGKYKKNLFLIDFGISDLRKKVKSEKFLNTNIVGAPIYESINSHMGFEALYKDDLESLMYTIVFLRNGVLPWSYNASRTYEGRREFMKEGKLATTTEELMQGLPVEYCEIFNYIKSI